MGDKAMKNMPFLVVIFAGLAAHALARVPETKKDPSLYGYWPLDEKEGTVAKDASIYGHDGKANGAQWAEGKLRRCLFFDGQDDYVSVPHTWYFGIRRHLTLEARVSVKGSDGRYYTPFEPAEGMYYDTCLYVFAHFKALLPAGRTELNVSRGPEYEPIPAGVSTESFP